MMRTNETSGEEVQKQSGIYEFDVVCGMEVNRETAKYKVPYHDLTYYFCSNNCKQHFETTPERYVWDK